MRAHFWVSGVYPPQARDSVAKRSFSPREKDVKIGKCGSEFAISDSLPSPPCSSALLSYGGRGHRIRGQVKLIRCEAS